MARICLISPGHLSTNPRLVKEADALADAGHDVRVIVADFALWAREADQSFANRNWKIAQTLRFGPNAPTSARLVQVARQRAARLLTVSGLCNSAIVSAAFHPIAPDLVAAAKRVQVDLYIAHYPAALPAAALAARYNGAVYAYDAEDFHLGDLPMTTEHDAMRRTIRAIEKEYLPGCGYVTAASPGIADAYAESYHIERPTVLLNTFPRSQAPIASTEKGTAEPGPSIYWFSQTIGPDRGLECAVRAIGRARSRPHLYLRGTPARGFGDRILDLARSVDAIDRLHLLPPASPAEMERLAAAYDVGLSGETGHTQNRQLALTNKLFSYLLAGMPIVASSVASQVELANNLRGAIRLYPIDDVDGLAVTLDALLSDSHALASARAAAFEYGQTRYNWDIEKTILIKCVHVSLSKWSNDRT
jgi:glycosyltransferase involved in cell wall biosynthesis